MELGDSYPNEAIHAFPGFMGALSDQDEVLNWAICSNE